MGGFEIDAAMTGHIAKQLDACRRYVMPVGGEIDRPRLMADGFVPVPECSIPHPAFTFEFNVSEKGFVEQGAPAMTLPVFVRMGLVQDLRQPDLLSQWQRLLPEQAAFRTESAPHSILIVPINRISDPNGEQGPGNRGWINGWMGVLLDMRQGQARVESDGEMIGLWVERTSIPMGKTGEYTLAEMIKQGLDTEAEIHRETALEVLAVLDFAIAHARKSAGIRRYEMGGRNVWRAGSGPLVPKRWLA